MLRKYEKYKDSGVEWIGEIPVGWEVKKIKHRCYVKGRVGWNGLKSSEFLTKGYSYLITGTDFKNDIIDWDNCYHIDQDRYEEDPFIQLQNEDLLITKDGTIGKLAVVSDLDKPACLNSGIFVVRSLNNDFSTRYLFWALKSNIFTQFNDYTSYGSTIQHLYQNVFVDFSFSFPTRSEQTTISSFLDRKTAEIDQLIVRKEKLIAYYEEEKTTIINHAVTKGIDPKVKTKPSGIEWLGGIPEHWVVKKLKFITSLLNDGTHGTFKRITSGYRLLSVRNIVNDEFVFREDDSRVSEEDFISITKQFIVTEGDIQLAIVGATLGKVAMVPKLDENFATQRSVATIRTKHDLINNKYLFYFLKSSSFQSFLWLNAGFSAQPGIYLGSLENCHIPTPNLLEQLTIVAHIETESARLDTIIEKFKKQIELLKEYRTTLISDVVTGKIDVRDEVAA